MADAVWLSEPFVPVMVRVKVPLAALPEAVTVIVDDVVVGFGEKDAVAPGCSPATDSETVPVKPLIGWIVTVYKVELPLGTDWEVGVTVSEKSGVVAALTTSVADAGWLSEPLVPVIVSG